MSSTHSVSCEFSSREISPIPLDRRVSFCGTAEPAVFEELRKNFITLSETDAMDQCTRLRNQSALDYEVADPVAFPASF